ncbi:Transposable element P transposase [Araneus ventricosus]|uniref:Transposable element P transposase n=1 Tax=Araneus ventricosus TaxID=182803 RepID=A0A4Y2I6D4_ARAVE|nr:Transposable element P transposase [Araneus ventricosus]
MSACAVATCPNYHRKTKGKGIIYHIFPVCPNRSKIWISKCKRQDHINVKYARICSDHFRPSDYMDDMKNRLLGLNQKKILKPDAVPSVNLPLQDNGEDISSRSERKRSILREAKIRLKCLSPKKVCETPSMEPFTTPTNEKICSSCFGTQKENALLLERIRFLEKELEKTKEETKKNQRKKIKEMKTKAQIARILTENKSLKSEVKKLSKIEENFKNILTATQINAVIENKSKIKWTAEDISRHLIIRSISRRAYEYWRNQIGIPLPSASTLKRWCSKFSCRPGMLHDVFLVMQKTFHSKPEAERVCILSFDEMHIDRKICYDVSEDQILGPFSKVQLVLARGIMAGWKQPVFFNFDTTMTKHLLYEIIKKIEEKGLIVKAIVSDLAGSSTLWKELEITSENNIFIHPLNCRKIWAFADPPHYLKLLRNHFLDTVNTREDSINEGYLTADILKNAFAEIDIQEIHEIPSEEDDLVAFENLCSEEFPMEWKIDEPSNYCGMTFSEHEGLKYIAGYIASRVRSKDSSLGYFSAEKTESESAPWIYALSKGGLTVPTEAWLKITEEMECLFVSIHGKSGYHSGKNVTKQMIKILEEKYPDVNRKAIKIFSRLRTFIRIRYLNRNSPKDIRKSEKKNEQVVEIQQLMSV